MIEAPLVRVEAGVVLAELQQAVASGPLVRSSYRADKMVQA